MKRSAFVAPASGDRLAALTMRQQTRNMRMESVAAVHVATRILRLPQVQDLVGLRRSAIYERIQSGEFPKPIKLGRASGWIAGEIEAWLNAQIEQSRR